MASDSRRTVLIGDANHQRASALKEILENEFLAEVRCVESYSQVYGEVDSVLNSDLEWNLVLLDKELRHTKTGGQVVFPRPFYSLKDTDPSLNLVCIGSQINLPEPNDPNLRLLYICVPSPLSTPEERQVVVNKLEVFLPRAGLPQVELENDAVLYEQVRALSKTRDSVEGKRILGFLIRRLNLPGCNKVIIAKLGQGLSGASVFRFRLDPDDPSIGERVLKLGPASDRWKFDFEIDGHKLARKHLGNSYKLHIADLKEVEPARSTPQYVVTHGDWCAICYDYLGGQRFGKFLDLETSIVCSPGDLEGLLQPLLQSRKIALTFPQDSIAARKWVLDTLLEWLCRNWYSNATLHARVDRRIWDYQDGPERKYVEFPPYQLSGKSKRHILSFLDSRQARMGAELFEEWETRRQIVRGFITQSEGDLTAVYSLHNEDSVIVSPAHGDLNANNILLWLDEAHPFLIDFPYYQEMGHSLQDFARLEVEIKFALMDQQEGSPTGKLPAKDYTHSQTRLWQALEAHLLIENWEGVDLVLPPGLFEENVRLSWELVMSLRAKAKAVQEQDKGGKADPGFWIEYRPALLFHTLRAIGYGSLSPFKRLLAVHSASELLEQCRRR